MVVAMVSCLKQLFNLINLQASALPILLFFLCKWLYTKTTLRENLPPSPPKLPILGNLHQVTTLPHRSLHALSKRYGELMLFHIGSMPTVIVSSARAAHEIMTTHGGVTFAHRPLRKTGEKLLYNRKGMTARPYGEKSSEMRSVCVVHLLSSRRVRSFRDVREEEAAKFIEKIEKSASSAVNLRELFVNFTNDMISRVALGKKYGEQEYGVRLNDLLKEFLRLLSSFNAGDFIPWLSWIDRINGWDAKVNKIAKEFDHFFEMVVKEHEAHHHHPDGSKAERVVDFVDVLLDFHKDNTTGFLRDRESIKALLLDLFIGGTEPTSTLLEWAMTELLKNPKVMELVQREVRMITGKNSHVVKEEDLEQMKYLKAVIKETLRLHPPGPMYPRQSTTEDAKIQGYHIPAGTVVFINVWAIHRDSAAWDDPDTFNPDRFLNSSSTGDSSRDLLLVPFGAGKRMCPAVLFSTANVTLLLANLVHRFDWALPEGETLDMSECFTLNLIRKTPLLAVATTHDFA